MSAVHKPKMADYHSKTPFFYTAWAESINLSKHRFRRILKYLHLSDNRAHIPRNEPGHDPLFKIRFMLKHLLEKIQIFMPGVELTFDEALMPYRGRMCFKVYMKNKPSRYGFRFECVCDAKTGLIVAFEMYAGKTQDNSIMVLVNRVLRDFVGKNHRVYLDRRYCSPTLFRDLISKGIYPVGTVMRNRKFLPADFKGLPKLKKREKIVKRCGQILATKWHDKRDVFVLSSVHENEMVETLNGRHARRAGGHGTPKPATAVAYNAHKTGVDKHDQAASYYPFGRKTVKWWKKLFFQLSELGYIQAHKYHNICNPHGKFTLIEFMQIVATELAKLANDGEIQPVAVPAAVREMRKTQNGHHFPVHHASTAKKTTSYKNMRSLQHKRQ